MPQIKDYTEQTSLNSTDEFVIQETAGGLTKKVLWSSMTSDLTSWEDTGETWVYDSADSPTFTALVSGDKRSKYSKGMKLRLEQDEALTSYWSFDSDLTDGVGSNDGTAIGGASVGAGGKFGNGLVLDGTGDAISIVDDASLRPTGAFTVGGWIKTLGVGTTIFQSYSTPSGTTLAGVSIRINSDGTLRVFIGKDTGLVLNTDYTDTSSKTVINDGNFHYTVITFKDNWLQIYIDGQLEASVYSLSPAYNATNYVRIGCANETGSNYNFFTGTIDDIFLRNGYVWDEETIRAKYEAGTAQGVSDVTIQKKFLLTGIDYDGSDTTLTMYGGTDFALSNSAISNPYFSIVQSPYNFNRNPDKWSVTITDVAAKTVGTPTINVWTPLYEITVPIGEWDIYYNFFMVITASSGQIGGYFTVSKTNNSEDSVASSSVIAGVSPSFGGMLVRKYKISLSTEQLYYVNIKVDTATVTEIMLYNQLSTAIIRATSIYI